jgi:HEPN domain-containing protein
MSPLRPEVQEWLLSAHSDLAYAQLEPPERGRYEQGAFHAQQAVEKALKGYLVHLDVDPPHTHNIQVLLDSVPERELPSEDLVAATALTRYAVFLRYPPFIDIVTREHWCEAVRLARLAFDWVSQRL